MKGVNAWRYAPIKQRPEKLKTLQLNVS